MAFLKSTHPLHWIFQFILLLALSISGYIFVKTLVLGDGQHKKVYSTWQFPMLLAIYIDTIYN